MENLKKTKIVATISDLNCDVPFLESLHEAGVNVFRMNTAHQKPEDTLKAIKNVRKVSDKIPIIVDTKGPEVRTTPLSVDPISVKSGDKLKFSGNPKKETSDKCIFLNYAKFHKEVPKGATILYDDGEIEFKVIEKKKDCLICRVLNSGTIKGKKSVNVPNVKLNLPSLTPKDKMYAEFSAKQDVDFIAHSFIRNKKDLISIQKILDKHKSRVKLIAKIENQEGVDNIDEILDYCAGIMVARGDLAVEIPAEKVPPIQKALIKKCIERRKIVITATQMLHTMIDNPRPTRAEVSDIANAIYDGTDCIMLSGETAYGKYPLEAVKIMTRVAKEIESKKKSFDETAVERVSTPREFIAKSAVRASLKLPTNAILTDTMTGRTAKYISAFRGKNLIYAICYDKRVMRELAFHYGVYASYRERKRNSTEFKSEIVLPFLRSRDFDDKDLMVLVGGSFGPSQGASFVEVTKIENLRRVKK